MTKDLSLKISLAEYLYNIYNHFSDEEQADFYRSYMESGGEIQEFTSFVNQICIIYKLILSNYLFFYHTIKCGRSFLEEVSSVLFQNLRRVILGVNIFDDFCQNSVLIKDECPAQGTHHGLAVHLLLSPCSEGLEHLCGSIGQ